MIKYLRIIPVIIVIILCFYEVSKYSYDLTSVETLENSEIYIEGFGTVRVDFMWHRNDMLIVTFSDTPASNILSYAFFKKGIGNRYKLIKAFSTEERVTYDVVEVENVLINITIEKDQIIENKFVIERDWRQSDLFMILVYFLAFSFIFSNKGILNLRNK